MLLSCSTFDPGHRNAFSRRGLHKACSAQPAESFANRCTGYSEFSTHARLVEPRPRLHVAGQDGFCEGMENFVR